jgi:DNA-binding NarL/FixJ family response regulator
MLEEMQQTIEVAVIDPGLPDGYGADLIKGLREKNPKAQVLVLSASLERAQIARAVEVGLRVSSTRQRTWRRWWGPCVAWGLERR